MSKPTIKEGLSSLTIDQGEERVDGYSPSSFITDTDVKQLQGLGYKQEFTREVSLFSQVGFSFLTMAMLPGWFISFNESFNAGGPMSLFWGYVVTTPFTFCVALALAEFISAYPINGGVYSWCRFLSNEKWGPSLPLICGCMFLAGCITAAMATGYGIVQAIIGCVNMYKNEANGDVLYANKGVQAVIFIIYIIIVIAYCSLGMKFNSYLNRFLVAWTALGTLIISITLPVMSPTHPSASWVFTEFNNETGYSNSGITFCLGLLPAAVTMIGYENGAHISEGTKNAAITGPRGILISVVSASIQGILVCIITLFSIQNVDEIISSSYPLGTLFLRSTNESVAIFFLVIVMVALVGCTCSMLLSGAQMIFSMARDGLLPYHQFWYALSKKYQVPLRALLLLGLVCIIVILPSLGSDVYMSIVLSATVIFMNTSYCIPCVCRLIWKRHDMPKGPFHLGRYSILIHSTAVAWILFLDVIMCMPRQINPLELITMNWSSVMLGIVVFVALGIYMISPTAPPPNNQETTHNQEKI